MLNKLPFWQFLSCSTLINCCLISLQLTLIYFFDSHLFIHLLYVSIYTFALSDFVSSIYCITFLFISFQKQSSNTFNLSFFACKYMRVFPLKPLCICSRFINTFCKDSAKVNSNEVQLEQRSIEGATWILLAYANTSVNNIKPLCALIVNSFMQWYRIN